MYKRLYRSRTNRTLCGVCGGLADYFNIDPTVVRVLTIVLGLIFTIFTVVAYFVMAVVIPLEETRNTGPGPD